MFSHPNFYLLLDMTDLLTPLSPDDEPSLTLNCRTQQQQWDQTLTQHEQEITQTVDLLTDLLTQHNSPQLRQRAIQYVSRFNNLKSRFQRLRLDMLCTDAVCPPTVCPEPRFTLYTGLDLSIRRMSDELTQLSSGCYQFLSVLVSLNLV